MDSTEDAFGWFQKKTTTDNFIDYFRPFFYYEIQREGTDNILPNNVFKFSFLDSNNNISDHQDTLRQPTEQQPRAIDNYIFPDTLEYLFFDAADPLENQRIELDAQKNTNYN